MLVNIPPSILCKAYLKTLQKEQQNDIAKWFELKMCNELILLSTIHSILDTFPN